MTVLCRSNDTILGCHGANAVHFSYLQEYVALSLGVAVGTYRQFSNNYHVYTDTPGYPSCNPAVMHSVDRYATGEAAPYPLFSTAKETFDKELQVFLQDMKLMHNTQYTEPFFSNVARPLVIVWKLRKAMLKDYGVASKIPKGEHDYLLSLVESIAASDWRIACTEWITRRSILGVT